MSLSTLYRSFIYLGFYVAFNTIQVMSRRVVGMAEETSTYSSSGFCPVNCRPTASNYQFSHLRSRRELNPGLKGGRRDYKGHITTGSFMGRGNLSMLRFCTVNCWPSVSNYQLSHINCRPLRWEVSVLPLQHCGPPNKVW